jgi:hypothetical protein
MRVCGVVVSLPCFAQDVVFAILMCEGQLVNLLRPKKFSLHPSGAIAVHYTAFAYWFTHAHTHTHLPTSTASNQLFRRTDLHLVFNLVASSSSFKTAESWTPLCLPKFDSKGFLHAHISYIDDGNTCLMLLSTKKDNDTFHGLSDCRARIATVTKCVALASHLTHMSVLSPVW